MRKYTYKDTKMFKKSYAIKLEKELTEKANKLVGEMADNIGTKLEQTLKDNIRLSYEPRSVRYL